MLCIAVICSTITLAAFLSMQDKFRFAGAEDVQRVKMGLIVGDVVGLNTDVDMLNFGVVMPGSGVFRSINITNARPYDIEVRLYQEGNITDLVSFPERVIVESGTSHSISVSAGVPYGSEGEYSGELIIAYFPLPSKD